MSRESLEKEIEKRMKKRSKTNNSNDNQTNMASLNLNQFRQYRKKSLVMNSAMARPGNRHINSGTTSPFD